MAVRLYMDVHVPFAITVQLRRRGVDVLTASDDDATRLEDAAVLERARILNRVLFTQDIRFAALAEQWQSTKRPFAGLVFGHQLSGTIGQFVEDLALIAEASDPADWLNTADRIPYRRS
jgi:hypothetical protein